MSKLSRATEFSTKERMKIKERDGGCIFCKMNYHVEECRDRYLLTPNQIMHYIPRSHQGLGIAKNGAWGCIWHHTMLDNGNQGRRQEMLLLFQSYLKKYYSDWKEEDLKYKKYDF